MDKLKYNWYCEKYNLVSDTVLPNPHCARDCEHLIRVTPGRVISRKLRREVHDRDGNKCIVCGSKDHLTIDHLIPLAHGGTNDKSNLATMCVSCNNKKGNQLIEYYVRLAKEQSMNQ